MRAVHLRRRSSTQQVRRDGSFGTGLQSDPGYEYRGHQGADGCDRGLRPNRHWLLIDFRGMVFLHGQDPKLTSTLSRDSVTTAGQLQRQGSPGLQQPSSCRGSRKRNGGCQEPQAAQR